VADALFGAGGGDSRTGLPADADEERVNIRRSEWPLIAARVAQIQSMRDITESCPSSLCFRTSVLPRQNTATQGRIPC
jgi:hypothetical protein